MLKPSVNVAVLEDVEYSKYVDCIPNDDEEKQHIAYYCHDIAKGCKRPSGEIRPFPILLQ